jgi:hypothetical protein
LLFGFFLLSITAVIDALVFANDFTGAAVESLGPVVGGGDGVEAIDDAEARGAVVDQLPTAFDFGVDFAATVLGAAAGTIEKAFGAAR